MIKTIVFFILCMSFAHVLSGQVIVNINITNLENNSGQIVLNFIDGGNKQENRYMEKSQTRSAH